ASLGGAGQSGGQGRFRGTRMAPGRRARDLLSDRLLSTLSPGACALVAHRWRCIARLAVSLVATHGFQSKKWKVESGEVSGKLVETLPQLLVHFSTFHFYFYSVNGFPARSDSTATRGSSKRTRERSAQCVHQPCWCGRPRTPRSCARSAAASSSREA